MGSGSWERQTTMSRSTTTTTTHILLKYSRSYPSVANQVSSQGQSAEWQHYANPVMRLVLDVKKSTQGELESIRLRILWSMNSGTDPMDVDQREVVFVRSDHSGPHILTVNWLRKGGCGPAVLLEFTTIPTAANEPRTSPQGSIPRCSGWYSVSAPWKQHERMTLLFRR
jgi:hypothetical protein